MMIDLEQLKADREAGTDGPWHLQHDDEIWSKDDLYVGMVGNTKDTRRIARLPELEAAYIEVATKLDKAVEALELEKAKIRIIKPYLTTCGCDGAYDNGCAVCTSNRLEDEAIAAIKGAKT